jgi:drug/metabolite transporter (DMT)-like permease
MAQNYGADRLAPLFILTAGTLWGSMGLFVRNFADAGCSSAEIVQLRCMTTAAMLFLYLLVHDRSLLKIRLRDLWCFLGTGVLSIVFFNLCYFSTIELTSLSVAAVLLYTAPAIVIVLSAVLFREQITGRKIAALALTFAGCICVSGLLCGGASLTPKSFFIGLGAGLGYALYSVFSRFALERGYQSLTISFYTFLCASIGLVPFVSMRRIGQTITSSLPMAVFIAVFGLVSTVLPYILYTRGLQGVENGRASILASVEPVVATLLGIAVFHEILHLDEAAGILLILGAIVISNGRSKSIPVYNS